MSAITEAREAIGQNNSSNNGKWVDWDDARHVIDTYEINADECDKQKIQLIINIAVEMEKTGMDSVEIDDIIYRALKYAYQEGI